MDELPPSDQFPIMNGEPKMSNDEFMDVDIERVCLQYKLWMALTQLQEFTFETIVDDGGDYAYSIEDELADLEKELA